MHQSRPPRIMSKTQKKWNQISLVTVLCLGGLLVAWKTHGQDFLKGLALLRKFQQLDTDQDGKLTDKELRNPVLFHSLDLDADGFVTLAESRKALEQFRNPAPVQPKEYVEEAPMKPRQGPEILRPGEHGVGQQLPNLEWTDILGKKGQLSFDEAQATVFIMTDSACPLSAKFQPSLSRLESEYSPEGIRFVWVDTFAEDDVMKARDWVETHSIQGPFVLDPELKLARALGALTTTDVFVVDASRTLRYRGAAHDQYGLGYALDAPREHFLEDALQAVLAQRPVVTAATWAPGCKLPEPVDAKEVASKAALAERVTYHNRISRLIQSHCLECHREGGVAPFSLASYEKVHARRGMMEYVLEEGLMPPWFAGKPEGHGLLWSNDRRLADSEKQDFLRWIQNGAPEGDPKDAPIPVSFPQTWAIGEPEAVFQLPREVVIQAEGQMPYVNLRVPTHFQEDRWVQALEVLPTAPEVVHHVLVFALPPAWDPEKGIRPAGRPFEREEGWDGFFAVYVPGNNKLVYPDGLAKPLPAGSVLHFQLHYTPNGRPITDRTKLGMVFADGPPRHQVRTAGIQNRRLDIPPGASNHPEQAFIPVPLDVRLLSFMPHMHVRGKAFRYELIHPDGRGQLLLDIPAYDFNWQINYRYQEPLAVSRGSRIVVKGWFDNSEGNPANPDPGKRVKWGDQTTDEMLIGYVEYILEEEQVASR